jgi:cell division septum initiation protein DivIVA
MAGRSVSKWRLERQLRAAVAELSAAREQVVVLAEQYAAFQDDDEDARSRALASSSVDDARVADAARRHAEVMRESLRRTEQRVVDLEKRRDELLSNYQP